MEGIEKYLGEKALKELSDRDWLDDEEKGELAMREVERFFDWAWALWKKEGDIPWLPKS